jgi:dTDP-4-amino-4,6-dideoxygalactose transaminase
VGARYEEGREVGSSGNLTCFSFYPTKPMTTGEGGMITLNDDELGEKLRILRLHGMSSGAWKRYSQKGSWYYEITEAGYKFNPSDIASAIGVEQLGKLDWMNEKRKLISEYYDKHLQGLDVICPYLDPKTKSSYHLYPVRITSYDRSKFIKQMAQKGIGTSVHFIPLHLMPFYQREYGYRGGDFRIAEKVFEDIVSLPIYPQLTEKQLEYIVKNIKEILSETYVKQ